MEESIDQTCDFPLGRCGGSHAGEASTSSSLLRGIRSNVPEAWRRVVALYGPKVYEWCRAAGLQPADAADVGQEVFQAVVSGIERFRKERPADTFRGWLWGITQNKLRDHWRRCGKTVRAAGGSNAQHQLAQIPQDLSAGSASSPAEADSARSDADLVQASLEMIRAEFQPQTWSAFWLVTIEGQSPADVGARLGMSRGAVYVAKSRVLRRLREQFEGLIPIDPSP